MSSGGGGAHAPASAPSQAAAQQPPPQLDFEALLSREYRPAHVTRLIPREAYHPESRKDEKHHHHHHHKSNHTTGGGGATDTQSGNSNSNSNSNDATAAAAAKDRVAAAALMNEETSRLVLSLVTQTPAFVRHLDESQQRQQRTFDGGGLSFSSSLLTTGGTGPESAHAAAARHRSHNHPSNIIEPAYHEIELGDWESKINWEGNRSTSNVAANNEEGGGTANNSSSASNNNSNMDTSSSNDNHPLALLRKPRNPFLDALRFDASTVCLDGDPARMLERSRNAPLVLELGVAGRSVARHVYQNTVLSAQRPVPALKSEAYQRRRENDGTYVMDKQPTTVADVHTKGTLHADKQKMEALIEARQKKRAQMAMDKTTRVQQAVGGLAMGGGRGRTVTSSLMGPGGTERTGRPSRHVGASLIDTEYVEQLDPVNNHTFVRDLSKVVLREFRRPRLPLAVVRLDLAWQFQIRYAPGNKDAAGGGGGGVGGRQSSAAGAGGGGMNIGASYQSMLMGGGANAQAGAISKAKLRTEADLTPTEGKLVMLEYFEERPPVQLNKGMCFKIVNYYRGDKARCPVSAGGGDRPARRKTVVDPASSSSGGQSGEGGGGGGSNRRNNTGMPRLTSAANDNTTVLDWVGKLPKKSSKDRSEQEAIDVLPEGVTEMLHPKVHGPFMGEIEEGTTLTALISNLFVAPMFRHEPESTDFLLILTPPGGVARPGQRESMGVVLRELPASIFSVGQTEPRTRVYAPNTQGEKNFVGPFVSYQIARAIARAEAREGHGLRFDEIQDRVMPNLELQANAIRQRLKQVAVYDKNTQIWTTKAIGYEDYPGVDALGKSISPEGVAAFETASAASRRLADLGIHHLFQGSQTVQSIGCAMVYLAGQLNYTRELARKTKKMVELSRVNKTISSVQITFYEKAAAELDATFKMLRQKHEIATFIYEELQLTPWHLTGEFIDVHKKGEGTGMMKLTGLGDPSGKGEGFSYLREVDSKPTKAVGNSSALTAQMKKITGTEDDLRKLTMKQMAALLRSYGMAQKQIDTLKRWDRVHVIRDLSTKAASDGIGDGLERFARGEKMKLSEQKQMYKDRINIIWRRQIAALSMDSGDKLGAAGADGGVAAAEGEDAVGGPGAAPKKSAAGDTDKDDSDSDSDDDLAATLEEEMMDRSEANQLVAAHTGGKSSEGTLGQRRAATQDHDLTKDARELAALKRQREEERAAQEGLQAMRTTDAATFAAGSKRKVIRKRITKTHPDGRQTVTFKFVLHPEEVGKSMERLLRDPGPDRSHREFKYEPNSDEKPPGHSMFEDDDDFEHSSKGRHHAHRRRGGRGAKKTAGGRATPRPKLQIGKLKTKISKEERVRKRKREEDELDVYTAPAKRKGTSNRRERGSIRDRRPHVIFSEKLEGIRTTIEERPFAGPFVKPVSRRVLPKYYEVISHPMDLQTIREKISKYEYRTADALIKDFELMKANAVKFNGQASPIAQEAVAIVEYVRDQVESNRSELTGLEEAVKEQMSGKPKKIKKGGATKKKTAAGAASSNVASVGGVAVNLGDLSQSMHFAASDSDDSFSGLLDL